MNEHNGKREADIANQMRPLELEFETEEEYKDFFNLIYDQPKPNERLLNLLKAYRKQKK